MSTRFTVLKTYIRYLQDSQMFPFSMDVMLDSDSIVVTSIAVTYLTLKNRSKVHQGHRPSNPSKILAKSKVQVRDDLCGLEKWVKQ